MKQAKRQYLNDYPSVTTVLGVLRKPALEWWFKVNTAKFCDEASAKGKIIGTQIHEAIQSHIELTEVKVSTQYPDEVMNALKSFMLFRKEHPELKLHKSEMMLTSEKHKCNGTLDCEGEDTELVIFDWKSGEAKEKDKPTIYDEHLIQLSAYVNFYNEIKNAAIKRAYILSLAKDKVAYNLLFVNEPMLNTCFNEVFLPALKIYNGQKQIIQLRKEL